MKRRRPNGMLVSRRYDVLRHERPVFRLALFARRRLVSLVVTTGVGEGDRPEVPMRNTVVCLEGILRRASLVQIIAYNHRAANGTTVQANIAECDIYVGAAKSSSVCDEGAVDRLPAYVLARFCHKTVRVSVLKHSAIPENAAAPRRRQCAP